MKLMLGAAMGLSTSTLSFISSSISASVSLNISVSASVYSSFGKQVNIETDEFGKNKTYIDYSVIAKTEDVSRWNLIPKQSKVYIDNEPYMIGGVVTTNPYLTWISLRNISNSI